MVETLFQTWVGVIVSLARMGTMEDASAPLTGALPGEAASFLNFCRIEKGLAANSLEAYQADLQKFVQFAGRQGGGAIPDVEAVRHYMDSLYRAGLGSRSVARHLSTLRSFYAFLVREGRIASDPTEHLGAPRQLQTIPKFLNLEEIERLSQSPDASRTTGVRDHAMIELLYARPDRESPYSGARLPHPESRR